MTTVEQIELLYQQLDNLNKEIDEFIDIEDYDTALEKVQSKDKLVKKIALAMKTTELTETQEAEFNVRNREISKRNFELIDRLQQLHKELAAERKTAREKLKLQNAYSQNVSHGSSVYVNTEE